MIVYLIVSTSFFESSTTTGRLMFSPFAKLELPFARAVQSSRVRRDDRADIEAESAVPLLRDERPAMSCGTIEGSFSAVSKPNFGSKYAFESYWLL